MDSESNIQLAEELCIKPTSCLTLFMADKKTRVFIQQKKHRSFAYLQQFKQLQKNLETYFAKSKKQKFKYRKNQTTLE